MQLSNAPCRAALVALLCAAWAGTANAMNVEDQTVETLMQYFTDSGKVRVRSAIGNYSVSLAPNTSLDLHWNNERVVVPAIDAAPGTQEAVDAITTASRPISGNAFQDFVKVRNELQSAFRRGPATVEYYVSDESDYLAQQLGASYTRDFDDSQLNLELGSSYSWDAIEPLADDDASTGPATKTTLHWNTIATRVLTPGTLVRVGVEVNLVEGLQHNPYRNVYAGGTHVTERHPDHRQRRDAFLKINQYLHNRSSLKLSYRFYDDDWGIDSHELGGKLSQTITSGVFASYEYRWYTQTPADFYRDEYVSAEGIDGYRTGDYRMGELSSHLFGFGLDFDLAALDVRAPVLDHMGLRFDIERYFNSNNYSANFVTTQLQYKF